MKHRLTLAAVLLAGTLSAPALAADPLAGIQNLHDYNLIVLGDLTTGHDVEGNTLVGGNMSGNSGTFGIGAAANPGQSSVASVPVLTVGGNNGSSNINIKNVGVSGLPGVAIHGNSNSLNDNIGTTDGVAIGGNYYGTAKLPSGQNDVWAVGGNITQGANIDSGTLKVGGSISGSINHNGGTYQTGVAGLQGTIQSNISNTVATVASNITALSSNLGALTLPTNPSLADFVGPALTLNAVDGGNGFALFNLNASQLTSLNSLTYNFASTTLPVIVNVFGGTSLTLGFNSASTNVANNQQVIWNFVDATSIDFTGNTFHGSVLAPNATVYNHTPIEGSIAVGNFVQGGEVHLGTYKLGLPSSPVPEPASWAMMIGGLGAVGAAMRRNAMRMNLRAA